MPQKFVRRVDPHASGAWFRKVESDASEDRRGIRAVAILPRVAFDARRHFTGPGGSDDYRTGPLDRPSVYLGGHAAEREIDVGLSWDRVYDAEGRPTYTDDDDELCDMGDLTRRFSKVAESAGVALVDGNGNLVARGVTEVHAFEKDLHPNFAYRPFWRTTDGGHNAWHNPKRGTPDNRYFYPGEGVVLRVEVTGLEIVRFDARLEGGNRHFWVRFAQDGFGVGNAQSFKRVLSIDQFTVDASGARRGLEGAAVLPTATTLRGGGWKEATLLLAGNKTAPMVGSRCTEVVGRDLKAVYDAVFTLRRSNARGGEMVDVTPTVG